MRNGEEKGKGSPASGQERLRVGVGWEATDIAHVTCSIANIQNSSETDYFKKK